MNMAQLPKVVQSTIQRLNKVNTPAAKAGKTFIRDVVNKGSKSRSALRGIGGALTVDAICNTLVESGLLDTMDQIDSQTRKILGDKGLLGFINKIMDPAFKQNAAIRNIARRIWSDTNDSRWYTHLQVHPNIQLQASYNKSFDVNLLEDKTPLLVAHNLLFNPSFNTTMLLDKYVQFYNILKNKKSLNQVLYTTGDLYVYDVICAAMAGIYSKLLFARNAYYTYDMYNPHIAHALIKSKGFTFDPYTGLNFRRTTTYLNQILCEMYNKMTQIVGGCDMIEKVVHECTCLVADCDIRSAATFHTFNWYAEGLGYYGNVELPKIPKESAENYSELYDEFIRLFNLITTVEEFTTQASDRYFVQSTRLSDYVAKINVDDVSGFDLSKVKSDEMILQQLHNATPIDFSTVVNFLKPNAVINSVFTNAFAIKLQGNILTGYKAVTSLRAGTNRDGDQDVKVEVVIPNLNTNYYNNIHVVENIDWSQSLLHNYFTTGNHIVSSPKDTLSEGDTFEILQYHANLTNIEVSTYLNGTNPTAVLNFEFNTFMSVITNSTIFNLDDNNALQSEIIKSYAITNNIAGSDLTKAKAISELQLASMIDYMPFYSRMFLDYGAEGRNAGDDISVFDIEYLSKFSDEKFLQMTQYVQTSLTHQQGVRDQRQTSY